MKDLFKALADFQQEVPAIHKGTKGYGYSYADLSTIFETINPILKKHDLGFTQLIQGDYINTKVFHTKTGDYIESNVDIPQNVVLKGQNEFQVLGSAITYLRRYALSSALGLVTDIDADGSSNQTKTTEPMKQKTGIPKATTRKPTSKASVSTQSKATASTQPKAESKPQDKVVTKEGDEFWEKAVKAVEAGVYTVEDCFDRLQWADDKIKEAFKKKMNK